MSWVIFSSETFLWATLIICQWWDVMHTVLSESSASLNRRTCSRCCSDWLDFITSVWTASSTWLYRHVTNSRESLQETEKTQKCCVLSEPAQNMLMYCKCTCFVVFNSFIVNIEHYWLVNIHQFSTYWSCFSSLRFILFIVSPLEYKGSCCWGNRINWDPAAVQTSWAQLSSNHDQMWLNWACWVQTYGGKYLKSSDWANRDSSFLVLARIDPPSLWRATNRVSSSTIFMDLLCSWMQDWTSWTIDLESLGAAFLSRSN